VWSPAVPETPMHRWCQGSLRVCVWCCWPARGTILWGTGSTAAGRRGGRWPGVSARGWPAWRGRQPVDSLRDKAARDGACCPRQLPVPVNSLSHTSTRLQILSGGCTLILQVSNRVSWLVQARCAAAREFSADIQRKNPAPTKRAKHVCVAPHATTQGTLQQNQASNNTCN
jgi:hypothetical protein